MPAEEEAIVEVRVTVMIGDDHWREARWLKFVRDKMDHLTFEI